MTLPTPRLNSMKPRLAISFSGGRSSAVMLHRCLDKFGSTHDILITFANTGCEHEETLRFVDAVDRHFCHPKEQRVVWLEAEIHSERKGPTAKMVTYETASRNGEPFEAAVTKHGVFCKTHPNCTGRLKDEPIHSFLREQGWKTGTYDTAIGIRADEADRMSSKAKTRRFVYPLVEEGWRKRDVNEFMARYDWDLNLPHDAWGNCTWCWKKSLRKLYTVAKADPSILDFPGRMERRHGMTKQEGHHQPRTFFRENRSAQDILKEAFTTHFRPYTDEIYHPELFNELLDVGSGCGETCEIGADE